MDPLQRPTAPDEDRIDRLRRALSGDLPGAQAHREAFPVGSGPRIIPEGMPVTGAAVLLILHPNPNGPGLRFPLIRRPDSMARHAGQVSLPGGAVGEGEEIRSCALREAREEIGLDPDRVEILGSLSTILIPVSGFQVDTVVGWMPIVPDYRPHPREVRRILLADPDRLLREGPRGSVERWRGGRSVAYPAYEVDGEPVWGATALILAEFLSVWRRVPGSPPRHDSSP